MLGAVHVVIAPDSFKGSLAADRVADALAEGLRRVRPEVEAVLRPIADGGEGTVAAALRAGYRPRTVTVSGPDGRQVEATLALDGTTAVVELATAAGLGLLRRPAPTTATTRGVGELVRAALDGGVRRIVLGIGGSATTDGGAGMLQALGVRLLDTDGAELPPGGGALARLDRVDPAGLDPRLAGVEFVVASDVTNPLIGPDGAAAVFGPQKGATPEQVAELDAALARYARVLGRDLGTDPSRVRGAGGAGGTAAGALAVLGASVVSGAGLVCELVGLDEVLGGAVLAVTGEGALDEQTLSGKAPSEVARRAGEAGVPCVAVAGVVRLAAERLGEAGFVAAHGLGEVEPDVQRCLAEPGPLLAELAARVLPPHLPAGDQPASSSPRR
jgi:glycerate 2-kinase